MATKPTNKQTPTQARRTAHSSDLAPFYAIAGLTDIVVTGLRERVVAGQAAAAAQQAALERQVRNLPEFVKTLPTQLRDQAETLISDVTTTYEDLAGRGIRAVEQVRHQARDVANTVSDQADDVTTVVADTVEPTVEGFEETVTTARKVATSETPKRTAAGRKSATTRETATKRAPAAKKSPAKKASAKEEGFGQEGIVR